MNVYDLLMKFDIIQIYCLSLCSSPLCFQENSVIKAQLAFRHATQICAHLQCTNNIRPDELTIAINQNVDTFNYIKKYLESKTPPFLGGQNPGYYQLL
jgi:hypothetical protein